MTEEDKEKLLEWRPNEYKDVVPQDVFDARMSLLSESDAKLMKAEFDSGRDPITKFLYFGGDMFGDLGSNSAALMTRCVYVGRDDKTSLRLFKGSAYAPLVDENLLPDMLSESVQFVDEFRDVMAKMGKDTQPHTKPRYMTHGRYGGK